MEIDSLQTLSFSSLAHDALVALSVATALLAGLVFTSLGLLLPGLLTSLGGQSRDPQGAYQEFGPAAPIISEPAPQRAMELETDLEPKHPGLPVPHRAE